MDKTHYDAIVMGGGMAGLPLALKLGGKGFAVALIERTGRSPFRGGDLNVRSVAQNAAKYFYWYHSRSSSHWGVSWIMKLFSRV